MWKLDLFLLPAILILGLHVVQGDAQRHLVQPFVSLYRIDESGFHFRWMFSRYFSNFIRRIELRAVPVESEVGAANASAVVSSRATEGSITTGLRPYTEYETVIVVTTVDDTREFPVGRARTWPAAPSAPTEVTAEAVSSTSIMVSWSPPAQANGPLKPYSVCCIRVGDNRCRTANTKDNTTTSTEVKELRPNTNYECYVEASISSLDTRWPATPTTKSAKSSPATTWPGTLHGLRVNEIVILDEHSLQVSWNQPEKVDGTLGGFTVYIRPYVQDSVARQKWQYLANVSADSRSYGISGLEPNTRYEFSVRGYVFPNKEGQGGGYSEYATSRVGLTWPSAPSVPTNVQLHADSSDRVTISWEAPAKPNGDIVNYTVFMKTKETDVWESNYTVSATTYAYSFVGLKPFTRIFAAVRAATAANDRGQGGGIGRLSPTKQITTSETAPGPVGDLRCAQDPAGSSRLVCRWQEPVDKNGLIRNYKIKAVDKHDADRVVFEGTSTSPTATIEQNFNFDHTFSVSVSAVTVEEGPALTIQLKLTETTEFPSAVVEPITQDIPAPLPSSPPVSVNSNECNIYVELSDVEFTQHSPVLCAGVLVDKGSIRPDNSFNGPLKPATDYLVKIRFHNKAGFTETSSVNIRTSSKADNNLCMCDGNVTTKLSSGAIAGIACLAAVAVVATAIVLKVYKGGSSANRMSTTTPLVTSFNMSTKQHSTLT